MRQRLAVEAQPSCGLAGIRQPVAEAVQALREAVGIVQRARAIERLAQNTPPPARNRARPEGPQVQQRLPLGALVADREGGIERGGL